MHINPEVSRQSLRYTKWIGGKRNQHTTSIRVCLPDHQGCCRHATHTHTTTFIQHFNIIQACMEEPSTDSLILFYSLPCFQT